MKDTARTHIRCPVHGFVSLEDWQREIVQQPAWQRLRRIRQTGMAELTYPSMTHSRFEHSLGVFAMATRLFHSVLVNSRDRIASAFRLNQDDFDRMQRIVQAAALLHDVGHAPLSHVSEPLLATGRSGEPLHHEVYSAAISRRKFADVIGAHPSNRAFGITADEIADFLLGDGLDPACRFWRGILVGQIDADRMDYLARDSLHAGVAYGRFDAQRIALTIMAVEDENADLAIGVDEGGWHAAEGVILARYFVFTQIYFHRTTAIFEHHMREALHEMLPGGTYPRPNGTDLDRFLDWDDWRVFGLLSKTNGEAAERILRRRSHAEAYCTTETPDAAELRRLDDARDALGDLLSFELVAHQSSWYQPTDDILVQTRTSGAKRLSEFSRPISALAPHQQTRLYVSRGDLERAISRLQARLSAKPYSSRKT